MFWSFGPSDFEFVSNFELRTSDLPVASGPAREEPAQLASIGFVSSLDPYFQLETGENWLCLAQRAGDLGPARRVESEI